MFTGDVVMGWASSLISPPDGDLAQFYDSLETLDALETDTFYPGHGDPIRDPKARLQELRHHRNARTDALRAALTSTPQSLEALTSQIYHDVPPSLLPAAARNLFAHLVWLYELGELVSHPELSTDAGFSKFLS